jgi:predicted ATP-grasp superfamily ATP-dependent carboligase
MKSPVVFVLTHESNPNRTEKSMSIIALAITRSLGRRGLSVVRVHPNRMDRSLSSRYVTAVEQCPDFYASEERLVEFLLAMAERYPGARVLVPASDDCAYFLARYRDRLQNAFAVVGPSWEVMKKIIDKKAQYAQAEAAGVPIPETYYPSGLDEVRRLAGEIQNYPYVIKPIVAHQWRLQSMQGISKGKKGFAVRDAKELIERYEQIGSGSEVMVQEVIGGRDERLFTFIGYCDTRGEPIAYCVRKKLRQMPIDFGYCTATVSCRDDTVVELSTKLLRAVGFSGICGVEWKLDPRTGIYKLIEINPRAVNTTAIAAASGVDVPHIAVMDHLGASPKPVTAWHEGVTWVNIIQDMWAARELNKQGTLTFAQWRQSLRRPRVSAVFAADDPRPFVGDFGEFIRVAVGGWFARR